MYDMCCLACSQVEEDTDGPTWCNTMKTLTALLVIVCALLVVVVLISMHKKTKRTVWAWLRVHVLRCGESFGILSYKEIDHVFLCFFVCFVGF